MTQPRHQPRPDSDYKVRLRLPTDGSVDLDKLIAALEARQVKPPPEPVVPEPEEKPVPEVVLPEPEPQPEVVKEPWAGWAVIREYAALIVAGGCALAAISFRVTWAVKGYGEAVAPGWIKWAFVLSGAGTLGILGTLLYRSLRTDEAEEVEVEPLEEESAESAGVWTWISNNAPTAVALFSIVLSFVLGLIWVGQKSSGGVGSPMIVWTFLGSMAVFVVAFCTVVFRQLKIEDSAAAQIWTEIKVKPSRAYVPALIFAGLVVLVFLGLSVFQKGPAEDIAQNPKPKTETPLIPGPGPGPGTEPPVTVPPGTEPATPKPPVTEPAKTYTPMPGYVGRMLKVLGVFVLMGGGAFFLTWARKLAFPDQASLQHAAKSNYYEFTRGIRTFLATQASYLLVMLTVGVGTAVLYVGAGIPLACWLWVAAGWGLSGLVILGAGAAGLDLLPQLDREITRDSGGTAVTRFMKRKLWQVVLGGLFLGGLMFVTRFEENEGWGSAFAMGSLGFGQIAAVMWGVNKLRKPEVTVESDDHLVRQSTYTAGRIPIPVPGCFLFNLPSLMFMGLLLSLGLLLIPIDLTLKDLWMIMPFGVVLAAFLASFIKVQRVLRNWHQFIFFPGILALVIDWYLEENFFFHTFLLLMLPAILISFVALPRSSTRERWMMVFPVNRGDYSPVINVETDHVRVRWGALLGVLAFVLTMLISAGMWVWSG